MKKCQKKDSLGHLSKYSSYKCLIDFYVRMSHMFFSFYVSCLINDVRFALKKVHLQLFLKRIWSAKTNVEKDIV